MYVYNTNIGRREHFKYSITVLPLDHYIVLPVNN